MTSFTDIAEELRRRISEGEWRAGARVPNERSLASEFAVARNTVRRALGRLEEDGFLSRHVGRGTFVKSAAGRRQDSFITRMRESSPSDVLEVRLIVEPRAAALAASRFTAADLEVIEEALRSSIAAKGIAEFEHWDGKLHLAIAAASKNQLLADYCRAINEVRNQPQWYQLKKRSLTAERRFRYDQQHSALVTALRSRDADGAARAMREHLTAVQENMIGLPGDG